MKFLVGILCLMLLAGCASTKSVSPTASTTTVEQDDDNFFADLFQKVTNVNCIVGFKLGTKFGNQGVTVQEVTVTDELRKYIKADDEIFTECYKAGLIINLNGGTPSTKAVREVIKGAVSKFLIGL